MQYLIEYQYMPKGADRPIDEGRAVDISLTDEGGFVLLPIAGDFVSIENPEGKGANFAGRVRTRAFYYVRSSDDSLSCVVNVVVQETDDEWDEVITNQSVI
jgi:hypothetical protein